MEYTITHSINDNAINIQVIHNKTDTYYESFIENTDTHRQIFENINNMELNFHICDTKLFLYFDYNSKSYDFEINKKDINTIKFKTLEAKYNALKDETTVQYKKLEDKYEDNYIQYKKLEDKYNALKINNSIQFKKLEEEQVKNICLRRNILKLEEQIHINEDQQPIIFHRMYKHTEDIFDVSRAGARALHFYKKSELISVNSAHTYKLDNYLDKHTYKIGLLRCSSINIYDIIQVIIPIRKIMKVWINNKTQPTYYTRGIYEILLKDIDMIWLGSEDCKDDIPDNLIELAKN